MIAADTDVLIDFLSGVEPVAAQIAGYVAADQLQTTAVTCFELLSGAGEGKTRRGHPPAARWSPRSGARPRGRRTGGLRVFQVNAARIRKRVVPDRQHRRVA